MLQQSKPPPPCHRSAYVAEIDNDNAYGTANNLLIALGYSLVALDRAGAVGALKRSQCALRKGKQILL